MEGLPLRDRLSIVLKGSSQTLLGSAQEGGHEGRELGE